MKFYQIFTNNYTPETKGKKTFIIQYYDYQLALECKQMLESEHKGSKYMYCQEGFVDKDTEDIKFWIEHNKAEYLLNKQ